jgi:hypothetical protein
MFARTRHTLRAGKQRRTLKQRGGAKFKKLTSWRTMEPENTRWKDILPGTKFEFLLSPDWITTNPEEYIIKKYTTLVECQDELFMYAMDAIYAELGAKKGDEADIMAKYAAYDKDLTNLTYYIRDVIEILSLDNETYKDSKIAKILDINNEPLLHLLLNPLRTQNHFIFNLASFIIHQKENEIQNFNEENAGIMAIRYDSVAKANTLNLTSTDLRDGPIISMPTSNVDAMLGTDKQDIKDSFWYKFLMLCYGKKTDYTDGGGLEYLSSFNTFEQSIKINNKSDSYGKYAILSAYVYLNYKKNKLTESYNHKAFATKNLTSNMDIRFVRHLVYTIQKFTKKEQPSLQEKQAEATPTVQQQNPVSPSGHQDSGVVRTVESKPQATPSQ